LKRLVDKHAPIKTRTLRIGHHDCRWLSQEARDDCRRLERRFRRTQSRADKLLFNTARRSAREAIDRSRSDDIRQRFADVAGNHAATWRVTREVLHRGHRTVHSDAECRSLADSFGQFFTDKIMKIHASIAASLQHLSGPVFTARQHVGPKLSQFAPVTYDEVYKVLKASCMKSSPLDVLPVSLLRQSIDVFVPPLAHMANLSFAKGRFPIHVSRLHKSCLS